MKNQIKIAFLVLLYMGGCNLLQAQLRFLPWSQNYVTVTSYLGVETPERFNSFKFELNGLNIQHNNWSLSARIVAPIHIISGGPNRSGKEFPADRISLRWTTDSNEPNNNLTTIGANRNSISLHSGGEVMLIERAKAPLSSRGRYYTEFTLFSSLKVAEGRYLDDFLSGRDQYTHIKYNVPVLFTLYDENGSILGSRQIDYTIHLHPTLTDGGLVDMEPDYSLLIETEAADATLRFLTRQDYTNGVSLSLPNAVKVNALTDYEVTVKATETNFTRDGGGTLPLSILSTQLTPGLGSSDVIANPKIVLSNLPQTLLIGRSKQKKKTQFFNLNYEANLTPTQIATSPSGTYTVSLVYLLMPR